MPLLIVAGLLILLALLFGPGLWANHTLKRYAGDRPDFPGTGGELARHLLDQAGLPEVTVESVPKGDHYDPLAKAVRLAGQHFDGRSLTAEVTKTCCSQTIGLAPVVKCERTRPESSATPRTAIVATGRDWRRAARSMPV